MTLFKKKVTSNQPLGRRIHHAHPVAVLHSHRQLRQSAACYSTHPSTGHQSFPPKKETNAVNERFTVSLQHNTAHNARLWTIALDTDTAS